MTSANPNIETLLRHQDWVRALARSLVADPARADDVAQQTMLEAIEKAPREIRHPKGWLAQVAKNAARAFARSDRRRAKREQQVAKSDVTHAGPSDAAERVAAHKSVVDALFELEEPYHTVVMLRYFEDLEPAQIAQQVGRPVSTVRTQVQRGLAQMRAKLDGRFGDRQAWCAALLPLFTRAKVASGVSLLTIFGSLAMWKLFVPSAAVVALLFVSVETIWNAPEPPAPSGGGTVEPAQVAEVDDVKNERKEAPTVEAPTVTEPTPPPAVAKEGLQGRMLAPDGAPMANMRVVYREPSRPRLEGSRLYVGNMSMDLDQPGVRRELESKLGRWMFAMGFGRHAKDVHRLVRGEELEFPSAVTDSFGCFAFDKDYEPANLRVEREGSMIYGKGKMLDDERQVFVVGPAVEFTGTVTDERGVPLEDVYVHMGMSIDSVPGVGQRLADSSYRSWNEHTGKDGSFRLGPLPQHAALSVHAQKRGHKGLTVKTTDIRGPVKWVLQTKPEPDRRVLKGIVRLANGQPAAKARLVFGSRRGFADESGQFEIEVARVRGDEDLIAYRRGIQPVVLAGLGKRLRQDPSAGTNIVVDLGAEALEISGKVVDAGGEPIRSVRILLVDGIKDGNAYQWIEGVVGEQKSDGIQTDRAGRFTLKGLGDRTYNIRAIDKAGMVVMETGPVAAGTKDLVIRTPKVAHRRLEGVVVDKHGQGVASATVGVMVRLIYKDGGGTLDRLATVECEADGRFVIERCPLANIHLSVDGIGVDWQKFEVPEHDAPVRFVVSRLHKFKLRVTGNTQANRFKLVDANGGRVSSARHSPGVVSHDYVHKIVAEHGPFYLVSDKATHLILLKDKQEVGRIPFNLQGLDLNTIDI